MKNLIKFKLKILHNLKKKTVSVIFLIDCLLIRNKLIIFKTILKVFTQIIAITFQTIFNHQRLNQDFHIVKNIVCYKMKTVLVV